MRPVKLISLICLVSLLVSCKGDKNIFTPTSSGRPYEVLVVINSAMWERPAGRALFDVLDTDVPGLPQPERSFRISNTDPKHFNRTFKIFRSIIIADVSTNYTQTKMKYSRNVYAAPQIILTIQSPNEEEFAEFTKKNSQTIVDFLTRVEMNREINALKDKHNNYISEKVDSIFGCDIWIPYELQSYKKGKNFFWASTNRANADLNFVMYSYPYTDKNTFTLDYFINKRDSVMKINIPGEREGMYMETDAEHVFSNNISVRGDYAMEVKGLWDVKNDMMGGPFVSHARVDQANGRVVVVEGFVYSPDKQKRNFMRKMEAALYTLKLPTEEQLPEIVILPSDNIQEEEMDTTAVAVK